MREEAIEFEAEGAAKPLTIPGVFRSPKDGTRAAVVIAHGSAGPDSRGPAYAAALAEVGISTLEIDMWRPRGLRGGLDRPKTVAETLPDLFGAFRYLTNRPEVDALRIGAMGFSWGGVLTMLSATRGVARRYLRNGERFAAHAPLYPVCWLYNNRAGFEFRDLSGAPILLQCAGDDDYDGPNAAQDMLAGLDASDRACLRTILHPGATHAFDLVDAPARSLDDPFAHQGRGGQVRIAPDVEAAQAARAAIVEFFGRTLRKG